MANVNSNKYTVIYATVITVIVAVILSLAATSLKGLQDKNVAIATMTDILKAVSLDDAEDIEATYKKYIKGTVVDFEGNKFETNIKPLDVNVKKESKKSKEERMYPVFIYTNDKGETNYIVPVRGFGLWDAIWGYVALGSDLNTVVGVAFDHVGETPGLGAEIKDNKAWGNSFKGKTIFDKSGNYVSVGVVKGVLTDEEHQVSSISGATMTSKGVSKMLFEGLQDYLPYFNKQKAS